MPRLIRASEEQWRLTLAYNFPEWGDSLSLDSYLAREYRQLATFSANPRERTQEPGQTSWILVSDDDADDDEARRRRSTTGSAKNEILAACETLSRPGVFYDAARNEVRQGMGLGIASVFVRPEFRGLGHASLMLRKLVTELESGGGSGGADNTPEREPGRQVGGRQVSGCRILASALWSDIGERFYEQFGWLTHPSMQSTITLHSNRATEPDDHDDDDDDDNPPARRRRQVDTDAWITADSLSAICNADRLSILAQFSSFATTAHPTTTTTTTTSTSDRKKSKWSFLPSADIILWHQARLETPLPVLGYRIDEGNFILWTCSSTTSPKLQILRVRFSQADNLLKLLHRAAEMARESRISQIVLWDHVLEQEAVKELGTVEVERMRTGSISALKIVGREDGFRFAQTAENVDWLNNEKFCWC